MCEYSPRHASEVLPATGGWMLEALAAGGLDEGLGEVSDGLGEKGEHGLGEKHLVKIWEYPVWRSSLIPPLLKLLTFSGTSQGISTAFGRTE